MDSEAYSYNGIQPSNRKQQIIYTCNNMDESQDYGEQSLNKDHVLYNSIYMKLKYKQNIFVLETIRTGIASRAWDKDKRA